MRYKINNIDAVYKMSYLVLSIVIALLSFLSHLAGEESVAIFLLIVSTFLITGFSDSNNIFHVSVLTGHYAFWVMPVAVMVNIGIDINYFVSFWIVLGIIYMIYFTRNCPPVKWNNYDNSISFLVYSVIYITSIFAMLITSGSTFLLLIGVVVVAAALRMTASGKIESFLIYISIIFYSALYWIFYWNGHGRLIVLGSMLCVTYMYIIRIGFSFMIKPIIMIVVPLAALGGTLLRFKDGSLRDAMWLATKDSTLSPLLLAGEIFDLRGSPEVSSFYGWLDQIILLFLAATPRVFWPSKPFGFGYIYTVENLDYYLAEAGHSVAGTFFGEHIYYLGSVFGPLGLFFVLTIMIVAFRVLSSPRIFGGCCSFVFGMWLPTFCWGGAQAFSARFEISCIPLVLFLWIYGVYVRRRIYKASLRISSARGDRKFVGGPSAVRPPTATARNSGSRR